MKRTGSDALAGASDYRAQKRARTDSMDTQAGSEQDLMCDVRCCKCSRVDQFECLQSAYDYGWFVWDSCEYCPAHAEEGIWAEELFAEKQENAHVEKEVKIVLGHVVNVVCRLGNIMGW